MKMRMLPIANVFRKFPRLVRDLGRDMGKDVHLEIVGEDTELDRSVIEAISDPLIHLIRNAVDHGLESPDERVKAGKAAFGSISLEASQEGNHVILSIRDDGRGLDTIAIRDKAIELGIITEDEATEMSSHEINMLIFRAGFSTATTLTDTSGRGVGMDVVRSNVTKLNGIIELDSQSGQGTTVIVKLPLTLTIITGMVVEVGEEDYVLPMSVVLETLKLRRQETSLVKGQLVLSLRDQFIPLISAGKFLQTVQEDDNESDKYIVVVSIGEQQVGLLVSKMKGQEEVVVKPMGQSLGGVPYFAGATLRGNGRVALILDVAAMFEAAPVKG